ncbi:hypothetical protein F5B22DRAFT_73038 [Xylaria bambusicola]|uniref:uncharacterized protein n=1 Tax=Xylaria bambusicola TaxID=326684 RepID=UPI00200879D9|nr:uncharacterized protein F5B22DRAFT_73038 [Xylaria bambusicola]KAI0502730.1 hypothetical protein F5B22DRAFT_73038 [Xylaria bambusicola]
MEQPPDPIQSELESFRQQWREEVSSRARSHAEPSSSSTSTLQTRDQQSLLSVGSSSASNRLPRRHEPPSHTKGPAYSTKLGQLDEDEDDYVPAPAFDVAGPSVAKVASGHTLDSHLNEKPKEPETALDFYEHAAERESTGKLGDSLQLYRRAFRMDDNVDRKYRDKHFASRWTKPAQKQPTNPPETTVAVPNATQPSRQGDRGAASGDADDAIPLSFPDLIASFAGLTVEGEPPECEGVEPPPCPIATLPDEILVHILQDVAIADVGDFVRLSQVCKRLAYLVMAEDRIWRRVCLGSEFGFGGMHHHFQRSINWKPVTLSDAVTDFEYEDDEADGGIYTVEDFHRRREAEAHATTLALYRGVKGYATWLSMFRRRPRVRFNGCYISTVNYIRPGQNSGHTLTWNTPVHIVTYYRYLRLFRDGTVISLTTTDEPAHVVHYLTRDNLPSLRRGNDTSHQNQQQHHLPAPVMASALKGRWRLSSLRDHRNQSHQGGEGGIGNILSTQRNAPPNIIAPKATPTQNSTETPSLSQSEGDLYIETEGAVGAKYTYRLDLSLRSAGRSTRNNKLVWQGFWSYNRLTDDWAQFTLKNDKPFFFSRVRSYGVTGE